MLHMSQARSKVKPIPPKPHTCHMPMPRLHRFNLSRPRPTFRKVHLTDAGRPLPRTSGNHPTDPSFARRRSYLLSSPLLYIFAALDPLLFRRLPTQVSEEEETKRNVGGGMKFRDEKLSTSNNNTNAHLIKSKSRRLRRLVLVKKMRSSAVSPNRNVVNGHRKKSRDGREIGPSEARKHPRKFKTKIEEEEAGLSSSSSARCEGKRSEVKPLGVIVAGCEGEGEEESSVACISHGFISVIGRRRVMEDAVTVAPGFVGDDEFGRCDFFAVYDGHGGAKVANACRDRMHHLVAEEVEKGMRAGGGVLGKGVEYWEKVMAACFERMDAEVSGGEAAGIGDKRDTLKTVGATAVMVMVGEEEMVAANCGDSRAVLCTGGIAVPLSHDHKPDRPDERERVEAAGGMVIDWNGSRVLGILATSRSIGDQYLKPFVTSAPEVKVMERSELDDFLVIATDGLWDVMSSEFACEIVKKCFEGQIRMRFSEKLTGSCAAEAAALLAELALARGSKDNISVIVVELKKNRARG